MDTNEELEAEREKEIEQFLRDEAARARHDNDNRNHLDYSMYADD